jgi:hypothetical protein
MMTGITDLERQSLHFLALVEVYLPKKYNGLATNKDPLQSVTSINTVTDSLEQQVSQEWDHIARHFQQYFQHSLEQLPVGAKSLSIDLYERKRINHLQSLSVLFPTEDVLVKYQTLRSQQLDKCFQNLLQDINADNMSCIARAMLNDLLKIPELKTIKSSFIIFKIILAR